MVERKTRVGDEMKRVLASVIKTELRDPRIPDLLSITDVVVSKDLSHAKVYFSVLGDEEVKAAAAQALVSAKGFLRREVGQRMKLRVVPEIVFKEDDSIERGFEMGRLIEQVRAQDSDKRNGAEENEDEA